MLPDNPLPPMASRIQVLRDHKGNTMTVGDSITAEDALEKMASGYDIELHTYVLQPSRKITR